MFSVEKFLGDPFCRFMLGAAPAHDAVLSRPTISGNPKSLHRAIVFRALGHSARPESNKNNCLKNEFK